MNINKFEKWNRLIATLTFFIALTVYSLTVEPTASYWDCAEYISTSAKLQVGHPPGAPLFQMLGAFFSSFAFEAENIAFMVNMMSVFASAFTILFLFLTTTIIGKKIVLKNAAILGLKIKTIDVKKEKPVLDENIFSNLKIKAKAIVVVHMGGRATEMDQIIKIAKIIIF